MLLDVNNKYTKRQLIGVTGYKRSGKDTAANWLVEKYGFEKYSFGTPLKKAVCEIFGWDFNEVEKNENKEKIDPIYGISYRQALQDLGTEWGQFGLAKRFPEFNNVTGRKLWVKRFASYYSNTTNNIVVADVRFPHEEAVIHAAGGKIIRVTRPSLKLEDTHDSEKHIETLKVDYDFLNDGTVEDLYKAIDKLVMI